MSDQWKDLDEVLELTRKQLPIGGQVIDFPDRISAETGALLLRIQHRAHERPELAQDGAKLVDGLVDQDRTEQLMAEVLGRSIEEFLPLVNMDFARLMHVFQTLMAWHLAGEDAARELWNDPGKIRALTPTLAGPSKGKAKSARRGSRASSPTSARSTRAASAGGSSSSTGG